MTPSAIMTVPRTRVKSVEEAVCERPRVAFFQAYWRLHSNVAYAALGLAEAGFCVDLFLFSSDDLLVRGMLDGVENVFIHVVDAKTRGQIIETSSSVTTVSEKKDVSGPNRSLRMNLRRIAGKLYGAARRSVNAEYGLIPTEANKHAIEIVSKHRYKAFIGVEKGGLVWAGPIAKKAKIPLVYFSLELYTRNHRYCQKPFRRRLKLAEEKSHRQCRATIVQDERRAKLLLDDNGVAEPMDLLLVPISRLDGPIKSDSTWLQGNLGLSDDARLILVHGLISPLRLSAELAKAAQSFEESWKLVFHGWGSDEMIDQIRAIDDNHRVCLSLTLVPPVQEAEVVGSAHIGIAVYDGTDMNERLTAFSSEKIALYLQCGVPVIAFGYEGYEHISRERCGVLIDSIDELPAAVKLIMDNYSEYRSRAFACFQRYYNFERNYQKVIDALVNLPG